MCAVPFYDGLVEFAVFSPVAVDCRNRASGSSIVKKYLFFVWELLGEKLVCKIKCLLLKRWNPQMQYITLVF